MLPLHYRAKPDSFWRNVHSFVKYVSRRRISATAKKLEETNVLPHIRSAMKNFFWALAFVTTLIGFIPQIIKAYRTKSMKDVSMFMLLNCWVCAFAWLAYGFCISDSGLILSEIFCLIVTTVSIMQKVKYDH